MGQPFYGTTQQVIMSDDIVIIKGDDKDLAPMLPADLTVVSLADLDRNVDMNTHYLLVCMFCSKYM